VKAFKSNPQLSNREEFRTLMKKINLEGGYRVLGTVDTDNLDNTLSQLIQNSSD
jgi:hypothetical protein